jgi:hypothetical protein
MNLKEPASFGTSLLQHFMNGGWGSLSKRDLELLIFILLERDGCLARSASNFQLGRELRITPQKVVALRRDAYARWREFVQESEEGVLIRIFRGALLAEALERSSVYATERKHNEGFIPVLIEHPDDRMTVENAIKQTGGMPVYERNREVLLIFYKDLIQLAFVRNLITDPKKVQRELKRLLGDPETLRGFLTKPVQDITPQDLRDALNDGGALMVERSVKKLPDLLRLIFPVPLP